MVILYICSNTQYFGMFVTLAFIYALYAWKYSEAVGE